MSTSESRDLVVVTPHGKDGTLAVLSGAVRVDEGGQVSVRGADLRGLAQRLTRLVRELDRLIEYREDNPEAGTLTSAELAERWGITEKTLANQRALGKGPAYVVAGRRIRYSLSAIEQVETAAA